MGERIREVQKTFKTVFNLQDFDTDGKVFDMLLKDGEILTAGSLKIKTLFTPGHTPACACYLIEDALFVGDAMFMPDSGTGRCDFLLAARKIFTIRFLRKFILCLMKREFSWGTIINPKVANCDLKLP